MDQNVLIQFNSGPTGLLTCWGIMKDFCLLLTGLQRGNRCFSNNDKLNEIIKVNKMININKMIKIIKIIEIIKFIKLIKNNKIVLNKIINNKIILKKIT